MSHKNYSLYSKKTENSENVSNQMIIKESEVKEIEGVNEIPEGTEVLDKVVIVPDNEENQNEDKLTVEFLEGVVVGCNKLNVRKSPDINSEVLCIINNGDKVKVKKTNSPIQLKDFYMVCTVTGIEGYCVSKYIEIM